MANQNTSNSPYDDVAKGLNSPEIRLNDNIPYVDEFVELEHVRADEPIRPKLLRDVEKNDVETFKEDRKIHASDLGAVHSPNSDTIVVDTPEGTLYITLDPESSKSSKPTSPSTQSTDVTDASPDRYKAFGALESDNLITVEKEVEQRRASLRRNSISMPTLPNLELLKQGYMRNDQYRLFGKIGVGRHNFRSQQRINHHQVFQTPDAFITTPKAVIIVAEVLKHVAQFFKNITRFVARGFKSKL